MNACEVHADNLDTAGDMSSLELELCAVSTVGFQFHISQPVEKV